MTARTPSKSNPPQSLDQELLAAKREMLALKERQVKLREGLPFLHGWKWYPWARKFFESANKLNFLCAANQISKSSTQIRKCIHWSTAGDALWQGLWGREPIQFWYLYPTAKQATAEFETKWQQFLPKGEYKDDPQYGWRVEYKNKEVHAIHFNSGVHLYFKTYSQDVMSLQTGTCDALFCDEELPVELYEELMFRISASNGYFHMVFTATLGQDYWRQVMEPGEDERELLPHAFKQTVSMYDCQFYEDGTPSHWAPDKIQMVIERCRNQNEIQKRVFGRFVMDDSGRKYEHFDIKRHMKPAHPLPAGWVVYAAADVGSGGKKGHPAAICFVAVNPDHSQGRVFFGWRGDGIETTASDVVLKFIQVKRENNIKPALQFYDWACKDFQVIATRMGEAFLPAEKSHEVGEQVLNDLFKNDMLAIYDTPELRKLAQELMSLRKETAKNKAKDDFCDALRYAVTKVPWNWSAIAKRARAALEDRLRVPESPKSANQMEIEERRRAFMEESHKKETLRVEQELEEWGELYDGY
jgi:hypothetical protein